MGFKYNTYCVIFKTRVLKDKLLGKSITLDIGKEMKLIMRMTCHNEEMVMIQLLSLCVFVNEYSSLSASHSNS